MPTNVIMPALEMAQETGKVVRWLKTPGDTVRKGERILEIETDKVTVEIESPAPGVLAHVTAQEGDVVLVGQTIAVIGDAGAAQPAPTGAPAAPVGAATAPAPAVGTVGRIMAERMTQSWTTAPHFYLVRKVNASRLISWRDRTKK